MATRYAGFNWKRYFGEDELKTIDVSNSMSIRCVSDENEWQGYCRHKI